MHTISYKKSLQELTFLVLLVLGGVLIANAQEPEKHKRVRVEIEVTEDGKTSTSIQELELDAESINGQLDEMIEEIEIILEEAVQDIEDTDLEIVIRQNQMAGRREHPHYRSFMYAMPEAPNAPKECEPMAFLGVVAAGLSDEEMDELDIDHGTKLISIVDGSAAEEAGLEEGDILLSIDGEKVSNFGEVAKAIRSHKPGEKTKLEFLRDGAKIKLDAELGSRTPKPNRGYSYNYNFDFDDHMDMSPKFDFDYRWVNLDKEDRAFLGIVGESNNEQEGVEITKIFDHSTAEEMGLQKGDIIRALNGEEVEDIGELVEVLNELKPGDELKVEYERDGKSEKVKGALKSARPFKEELIHKHSGKNGKEMMKYVYRIELEELEEDEIAELNKRSGKDLDVSNSLVTERYSISPNPSDGVFFLDMQVGADESVDVLVMDSNGRLILEESKTPMEGEVLQRIDLTEEPSGVFIISITQSGKSKVSRIVKH